jgi:hypothetical protein
MIPNLPDNSPVFVFPLSRPVSKNEERILLEACEKFLVQWKSHNQPVAAHVWTEEHRFLLIAADPTMNLPGGCSKDKLFHFVTELMNEAGFCEAPLHLFWVKSDTGLHSFSRKDLKEGWKKEEISPESQLLPTWISDLGQYREFWKKPLTHFSSMLA